MTRRSLLIAVMSATGAAVAQKLTSGQPDKFALANEDVKELLLLMDTDKNGRISKLESSTSAMHVCHFRRDIQLATILQWACSA